MSQPSSDVRSAARDEGAPVASSRTRRYVAILAGVAFSVLFGWLTVRGVDWTAAGQVLRRTHWGWVTLYTLTLIGIQALRMVRWSLQLHSLGETRWRRSLSVGAVGLSAIYFLPARIGEAVRPLLIAEHGRVSVGEGVATSVVERLIDGLFVGLLLIGVGVWVRDGVARGETIERAGLMVGGAFLALTIGVFVAVRYAHLANRIVDLTLGHRAPRLAFRVRGLIDNFRGGVQVLARGGHVPAYLGLTAVMWLVNGASIALLFQAVAFDLPLECAFVVLSATAVGILVPAAPTSVGTLHFAAMWALSLYDVPDASALDFAILYHLTQVVANLVVGVAGAGAGGLSFERLRRTFASPAHT